jgi:hypothetical protein
MTMTPGLRKFALTAHVTFSVGWLGAVVAYLAVAIACLASQDAQVAQSGYFTMELTGWYVIVPLSLAALLTGLVQSLGTEWGLFRYYWILVKLVLTLGAVTILLMHGGPQVRRPGRGSPRRGWSAGVARNHDVVGVQAMGENRPRIDRQHALGAVRTAWDHRRRAAVSRPAPHRRWPRRPWRPLRIAHQPRPAGGRWRPLTPGVA